MHYSLPSSCHLLFIIFVLSITGCSDHPEEKALNANEISKTSTQSTQPPQINDIAPANKQPSPKINYEKLRRKITYAEATHPEVLSALTERDIGALTNTIHALYSMRWNRATLNLLDDMWELKKGKHPDLAWDLIAKAPARIALASTLNRIHILNMQEQKAYIRAHKDDEHEFHRAQVVVSLGLNGDPVDVPYLKEMAGGINVFVAQSAITGLGLMNNKQASDALIELYNLYKNDARADLLLEVLKTAYELYPEPMAKSSHQVQKDS